MSKLDEEVGFVRRDEAKVAIFMILLRSDTGSDGGLEVLLQERCNTGYMDGMFDFSASGHLKKGESYKQCAVREAKEELGVTVREEDADFAFLGQQVDAGYVRIFFVATVWEGVPRIMEQNKCSRLGWFKTNELPDNVIPSNVQVLKAILAGEVYGAF